MIIAQILLILAFSALLICGPPTAWAGNAHAPPSGPATDNSPQTAATRIEVNQQDGVILFYIDGKIAARIDAKGFAVNGTVAYSGVLQKTLPKTANETESARPVKGARDEK